MTLREQFGSRVKSLRESKGWTQEYLAEKMDISSNYISCIERGKENPTFDMMEKLVKGLDVKMWQLFDFESEQRPKTLKKLLTKIESGMNETELKLAVKLLTALTR